MQRQLAKYPFIGLNQDDSEYNLKPGQCRNILNALPIGLSSMGGLQNVPGTTVRNNASLPAGTNTFIGHYVDAPNNRVFYFVHNSFGNHGVWYFSPNTNTHTKVLQTSYLNFSTSNRITGISCIEDILQWSDGLNEPRSLIVARAVAEDLYDFASQEAFESQLSLYKPGPNIPPSVSRLADSGVLVNNITSDSFQFCVRFVFKDNTVSKPGPLSVLSPADFYPKFNSGNNYISVTQVVGSYLENLVKKVQFIYVKNNTGDYSIFKEEDGVGNGAYNVSFYNTESVEVIPPEEVSPVNFIPNLSKNLIVHEQRAITTLDQYDYADVGNFSFSIATSNTTPTTGGKLHLPGSSETYGIMFFDGKGRTNGVLKKAAVYIPKQYSTSSSLSLPNSSIPIRASFTISGTPPSWAKTYVIVKKKNNTVSTYAQVRADVFFYKREDNGTALGSDEFLDQGNIYLRTPPSSLSDGRVYLRLPQNFPLSLDDSYVVRLMTNIGQTTDVEPVISVEGDKVVCGNFGITSWAAVTNYSPYIQIEKYKDVQDEFYFEVGSHYFVSGGAFTTTSAVLEGDMTYQNFTASYAKVGVDLATRPNYTCIAASFPEGNIPYFVVTPSPTTSRITIEDSKTSIEKESLGKLERVIKEIGSFGLANTKPKEKEITISSLKTNYTIDYNKIASDFGRAWIEVPNKKINYEPTTLSISDKYVFNSQINGINNFRSLYALPTSRTPIRKLQNVGENLMLAIHERTVTSLASYSGDNVLHTSDGSQIVGDGKSVFGYDRELRGSYGTIYPDSVVEYNGRVYFFDPFKGEIVRYAANGLTPIGSVYKMGTYFRAMGKIYIDRTTNNRNVFGGYDPQRDMVYFCFRSDLSSEWGTIAFIDKPGEERWFSFYNYRQIDGIVSINNRMFMFYGGQLWENNVDATYNRYFNVLNVETQVDLLFNTEPSRDKLLRSISTESDNPWNFSNISVNKVGQSTDMVTRAAESTFVRKDDVYYTDVKRNVNTPAGMLPPGKSGLVAGQPLIGKIYEITMKDDSQTESKIHAVNFMYQPSSGHRVV